MKKWLLIMLIGLSFVIVACSSDDHSMESADNSGSNEMVREDMANGNYDYDHAEADGEAATDTEQQSNQTENTNSASQVERKVIYNAELGIQVDDYNSSVNTIEKKVQETGGYVVESRTYGGADDDLQEGMIRVRIPQEHFEDFIKTVENGSLKVMERSVTGQDVTEEFVDLESRLKSKRVVEERLISFMEQAEKTEDLLKISNDLAKVQEEIEGITGRMNYLQNKADLATVRIYISENKVNIPGVNQEGLNTWEKTKQQFFESINFLLAAISGITIFVVGNIPILLTLAIIGLIIYLIVRKQVKKDSVVKEQKTNMTTTSNTDEQSYKVNDNDNDGKGNS